MSKPINSRWAAEQVVRFMKCLRSKLEAQVGDDEVVIRDTIEGEVDVDPVMEKLIGLRQEAKAMAASRKELAKTYNEAAGADIERERKTKALMLECLKAAGIDKWKGVAGSVSILGGGWSTEITDAAKVPLQYMKAVPDIDKIKGELSSLRVELEAMHDDALIESAILEGIEDAAALRALPGRPARPVSDDMRAALINGCLERRIPGARIVKGEDTLGIYLPRSKKAKAEEPVDA